MAPPADRVRPYKHEDSTTGGQAGQRRPFPKALTPQEDGIDVAGVFFQEAGTDDEEVVIWRETGALRFRDATMAAGTSYTLAQLAAGGGGGVVLSNQTPSTLQAGVAATPGTGGEASRYDHKHLIAWGAPTSAGGSSNSAGTSLAFSRSDHKHALDLASSSNVGGVAVSGGGLYMSGNYIRVDYGIGLALDGFGRLYATGGGGTTDTEFARARTVAHWTADHQHGGSPFMVKVSNGSGEFPDCSPGYNGHEGFRTLVDLENATAIRFWMILYTSPGDEVFGWVECSDDYGNNWLPADGGGPAPMAHLEIGGGDSYGPMGNLVKSEWAKLDGAFAKQDTFTRIWIEAAGSKAMDFEVLAAGIEVAYNIAP